MDIEEVFNKTQREYDKEYKTEQLNIVTTTMDKTGDKCDGHDTVTVTKYYTVKPKEYYTDRQYDEHYGRTMWRTTQVIKPRDFYNRHELEMFIRYINKIAGRTLEDDEMTLLLRHITNGRQYELTCVLDITDECERATVWEDKK